jgi:hypothetical protein
MNNLHETLIKGGFELLTLKGLKGLTPEALAHQCNLFLPEITNLCPTSLSILLLLWSDIEERAPNLQGMGLATHDYLFESVMNHLDLLEPHREAAQRFVQDLSFAPGWLLDIKPYANRWSRRILEEAGVSIQGIQGEIKISIFSLFCLYTLKTWSQDTTSDRSLTLSFIDQGLKNLEDWQEKIKETIFPLKAFV